MAMAMRSARRGRLTLATSAAVGLVLVLLAAASGAIVADDGTLVEPFGALALGSVLLTGAGLAALVRMFRSVRSGSSCGRGAC